MSSVRVRPSRAPKPESEDHKPPDLERPAEKKKTWCGTVNLVKETFAFVQADENDEEFMILPSTCRDWDGELPRAGTRVLFQAEEHATRGSRRKATHVWHEPGRKHWEHQESREGRSGSQTVYDMYDKKNISKAKERESERKRWDADDWQNAKPSRKFHGTMDKDDGNYGFILQDAGNGYEAQRMFVLPWSCPDSTLPEIGSRVEFSIVTDERTGKPRAEDVIPEGKGDDSRFQSEWNLQPGELCTGTMCIDKIKHGFIRADYTNEYLFVVPSNCSGFEGLPRLGTRVKFTVEDDPKGGRSRLARDVCPEMDPEANEPGFKGAFKGVMKKNLGNFGFVAEGEEEIFVLPSSCRGNQLFEVDTRVTFRKTTCKRSGKPMAEKVDVDLDPPNEPEEIDNTTLTDVGVRGVLSFVSDRGRKSFGFVQVEDRSDRVYLHVKECPDRWMPAVGTELAFDVYNDRGKPAATNVSICQREPEVPRETTEVVMIPRMARSYSSYKSPEIAILWKKYCDEHAAGQYDVEEHSAFFLRQFLHDVLPDDVPAAKRQRT